MNQDEQIVESWLKRYAKKYALPLNDETISDIRKGLDFAREEEREIWISHTELIVASLREVKMTELAQAIENTLKELTSPTDKQETK